MTLSTGYAIINSLDNAQGTGPHHSQLARTAAAFCAHQRNTTGTLPVAFTTNSYAEKQNAAAYSLARGIVSGSAFGEF